MFIETGMLRELSPVGRYVYQPYEDSFIRYSPDSDPLRFRQPHLSCEERLQHRLFDGDGFIAAFF